MKLIIVRHGQTKANLEGVIEGGGREGELSELGWKQVKKVALRLKDEKIDYIYSSPLKRAADTAKEIAKFHPDTPLKFVDDLREQNLGELEGKTKAELGFEKHVVVKPKTGEPDEKFFERAKNFILKLLEKHHGKTVLIVAHGGINNNIICFITGKDYHENRSMPVLPNTSLTIFEFDEDKNHKIVLMGCAKHLEA
ncbi:MAG: histidine phosphatase family protein [archaeon]